MARAYDPFDEMARLRRRIAQLFDEADTVRPAVHLAPPSWAPAVDILETAEAVTVELEVPGVAREDIEVELQEARLSISGERPAPAGESEGVCRRRETPRGRFGRSFVLPMGLDGDQTQAVLRDGVLTLRIPRRGSGA